MNTHNLNHIRERQKKKKKKEPAKRVAGRHYT